MKPTSPEPKKGVQKPKNNQEATIEKQLHKELGNTFPPNNKIDLNNDPNSKKGVIETTTKKTGVISKIQKPKPE